MAYYHGSMSKNAYMLQRLSEMEQTALYSLRDALNRVASHLSHQPLTKEEQEQFDALVVKTYPKTKDYLQADKSLKISDLRNSFLKALDEKTAPARKALQAKRILVEQEFLKARDEVMLGKASVEALERFQKAIDAIVKA